MQEKAKVRGDGQVLLERAGWCGWHQGCTRDGRGREHNAHHDTSHDRRTRGANLRRRLRGGPGARRAGTSLSIRSLSKGRHIPIHPYPYVAQVRWSGSPGGTPPAAIAGSYNQPTNQPTNTRGVSGHSHNPGGSASQRRSWPPVRACYLGIRTGYIVFLCRRSYAFWLLGIWDIVNLHSALGYCKPPFSPGRLNVFFKNEFV